MFQGEVLNYNTYDKEFHALVHVLKNWRQYVLGKEIVLHMDHHPLIFLNSQSKFKINDTSSGLPTSKNSTVIIYNMCCVNKVIYLLDLSLTLTFPIIDIHITIYGEWKK